MNRAKRALYVAGVAGGVAGLLAAALFAWKIGVALRDSREEARAEKEIGFVVRTYAPVAAPLFDAISTPADFVRAERFHGHLFIAGSGGLSEYDAEGKLVRWFGAGRELPPCAVVGLTRTTLPESPAEELIVTTAEAGLLAYDGQTFRQIYPRKREFRRITATLAGNNGHLLLGTHDHGVLVYDGKAITPLHPTLANTKVTALAGTETDLWVGTIDQGVLHWHAGETEAFGEREGVPDPQVLSLALDGDKAYVGTALGVLEFEHGKFSRVIRSGVFATALLASPRGLMVGTEDQGVLAFPREKSQPATWVRGTEQAAEVRQIFALDEDVYVLSRASVVRMNARGQGWEPMLEARSSALTDRNISALAVEDSSRLWVGYFNHGLDLLDGSGGKVKHFEDEHLFCVNRLLIEPGSGVVDAATANGLVRMGAAGGVEQVLTRSAGLIADHVTDVAAYGDGLVLATPAGLTLVDSHGARSLYAFQGLVNNHVYALGVSGEDVIAGTLGGISVIRHEVPQANYTAANSGLRHNWITAVVRAGDGWLVGTYGAGVMSLDRDFRFRPLEGASEAFNVNPNAMLVTGERVFVGTMGRGLGVYDLTTGRWREIREGLPSSNVTALAAGHGYLYIGTDNGLVRAEERRLEP